MRKIPLAKPMISEDEKKNVLEVLDSGWLVEGKWCNKLEREFSKFVGSKNAITVSNGTAALHVAMEALGIKPGDEVVTTAFTFIASSNSILFVGGVPIFADISIRSYNIDPEDVRRRISKKTKAILAVHIFGLPADMKTLKEIAEENGLYLIEDCAQAHGAYIDGKHVGTFGDVGIFSFYATKNMMSGEGGMIVTESDEIAERCKSIKNHGRGPEGGYKHYMVGYNYRMTDLHAAIAMAQLKKLPEMLKMRERNARIIREYIEDLDVIGLQEIPKGYRHANYIFAPYIKDEKVRREEVIEELKRRGISSRSIYSIPSYRQPAYLNVKNWRWAKFVEYPDYSKVSLKNTEKICSSHFEVPIHPQISEEDANYIGENLRDVLISLKSK
ncbi:MAG: DegT/DnrJ/EryC1/StrS family aminotransferase [Candidatus Odinarchaeota archaeon]|nr:DegT/DnrJ/EryC1/StrS family aminotransferase [Candidatus Odinarchaeota archaeon]